MNCKKCGAQLDIIDDRYVCPCCGTKYVVREQVIVDKSVVKEPEFLIIGGLLKKYLGNRCEVMIPEGVVSIGKEAFKDNFLVTKIMFSNSVLIIEERAFYNCLNLNEIVNYKNVRCFKNECFMHSGLRKLTIGSNVTELGKGSFAYCSNLSYINYCPEKDLKLENTFANCCNLTDVDMDRKYFFPSFHLSIYLKNNQENKRPTFADAFRLTPFFTKTKDDYLKLYKEGICPDCGGKIKKKIFHAKCSRCGIDFIN